ncbi:MAG: OmpA family protein [Methylophilus sp.]
MSNHKFKCWLWVKYPLVVMSLAILAGCATGRDRVVLLPNQDGTPSAVVVKTSKGEEILDKPYDAVSVSDNGVIKSSVEKEAEVKTNYGNVLEAQPQRPVSYMLYFISGTDELTPESKIKLEKVKSELIARSAPEITAIGHTDTVGRAIDNDALSLERATTMRRVLVEFGISNEHFTVAGRGERELLIPTADSVDEERNRRVELNVR